jgi:hypothetical protein
VTKRRAIVGANMPWIGDAYGHDLGRNQAHPDWPVEFDPDRVSKLFAVLREFGVRHVRLWLFEDAEGLLCTGEGLVDGLDRAFLDNLRAVALLAERHDIRIYWTLLDANSLRRRPDMITRRVLSQDDAASVFFDKAVAPILPIIAPSAWALDLCNEPEAIVRGNLGNKTALGFRWWDVAARLNLLADRIRRERPELAILTGSGFQDHRSIEAGQYAGLRLDGLDYHLHAHMGVVRDADQLSTDRPVVIGELGWPTPDSWPRDRSSWIEVQTRLAGRLRHVVERGPAAIYLWFLTDLDSDDPGSLVYRGEAGAALHAVHDLQRQGAVASEAEGRNSPLERRLPCAGLFRGAE